MFSLLLQIYLYTCHERAALSQLSQVDALANDVGSHCKLRIGAKVVGECEHVVGLYPELQALDVLRVERQVLAECNSFQAEIAAILNPAVAETGVAHRILECDAGNVRLLSLGLPATSQSSGLVHKT